MAVRAKAENAKYRQGAMTRGVGRLRVGELLRHGGSKANAIISNVSGALSMVGRVPLAHRYCTI